MLDKFCSIWDEWHLNDMRPYCKHQKELGWDKLAVTPVTLYHYRLNSKTLRLQESMKKSSWKMLCDGMTAALSDDQIEVAKLPYSLTLPHEISGEAALYYEPQKPLYPEWLVRPKQRPSAGSILRNTLMEFSASLARSAATSTDTRG